MTHDYYVPRSRRELIAFFEKIRLAGLSDVYDSLWSVEVEVCQNVH